MKGSLGLEVRTELALFAMQAPMNLHSSIWSALSLEFAWRESLQNIWDLQLSEQSPMQLIKLICCPPFLNNKSREFRDFNTFDALPCYKLWSLGTKILHANHIPNLFAFSDDSQAAFF